jgi:hypothetical protein
MAGARPEIGGLASENERLTNGCANRTLRFLNVVYRMDVPEIRVIFL